MKTIYAFISLLFMATLIQAQIPNASFETWSNNAPTGWIADTGLVMSNIAYDGSYAARLNVVEVGGYSLGATLTSSSSANQSSFFHVTSAPIALHLWYIGHPAVDGDQLFISTVAIPAVQTSQDVGGIGDLSITDSSSVYKEFVVNYNYPLNVSADSVSIILELINSTSFTLNPNTYFIVDDLSFGPAETTDVAQVNNEPVLEQCTPNPANNTANIIYSITGNGTVNLALYDILGNKVKTLLENINQTQGRYKVPTDVSGLPGGIYFYRLNVNGQCFTQKLIVSK